MARSKIGYFTGKAFWKKFDEQRAEYGGDDAQLNVYVEDGNLKLWVAVCESGGNGDPINDSHLCPGSPGC
jgi:hypothetical protein